LSCFLSPSSSSRSRSRLLEHIDAPCLAMPRKDEKCLYEVKERRKGVCVFVCRLVSMLSPSNRRLPSSLPFSTLRSLARLGSRSSLPSPSLTGPRRRQGCAAGQSKQRECVRRLDGLFPFRYDFLLDGKRTLTFAPPLNLDPLDLFSLSVPLKPFSSSPRSARPTSASRSSSTRTKTRGTR